MSDAIRVQLSKEGWHLSDEFFSARGDSGNVTEMKSIALSCDMRKGNICVPALPANVQTATEETLTGPIVLQLVSATNIAIPSSKRTEMTTLSVNMVPRIMQMVLTDGHLKVNAIEVDRLAGLGHKNLIPGTKLLFKGGRMISGT